MSLPDTVLDEEPHPGAAGLGERLARRTAGQDVDPRRAEDAPHLFDPFRVTQVPSDGHPGEVVGMGRERIGVEVGTEHDAHPRLLQTEAHSARTGEQVGGEEGPLGRGPQATHQVSEFRRVAAVIWVLGETQRLTTRETWGGRVCLESHRADSTKSNRHRRRGEPLVIPCSSSLRRRGRRGDRRGTRRRGCPGRCGTSRLSAAWRAVASVPTEGSSDRPAPRARWRLGGHRPFAGSLRVTDAP